MTLLIALRIHHLLKLHFASDPNWGRILAAIGYAGVKDLDVLKFKVWLDDVQIQ